jgi:hypothetical protein
MVTRSGSHLFSMDRIGVVFSEVSCFRNLCCHVQRYSEHIHTVLYSFRVVHHRLCLGILYSTSKSGNVLQI